MANSNDTDDDRFTRRKALKGIGAGAGLATLVAGPWSQPAEASHETPEEELGLLMLKALAGNGNFGYGGDGGPALEAQLGLVYDVATDSQGNVYIDDLFNNRTRKVDHDTGTITTIADTVGGLAVDSEDNVYIRDMGNKSIRKIDADTEEISTVDGTEGNILSWGSMAVDGKYLYAPERDGHRVRRVDLEDGSISTIAGTGEAGYNGDNQPATEAQIDQPTDVTVHDGNIYISERRGGRVRKVDASGTITTAAGTGKTRTPFQGGPIEATDAHLNFVFGVEFDDLGNLYIAGWQRLFKLDDNGMVTSVTGAGNIRNGFEDGVKAEKANLRTFGVDFHEDLGVLIGSGNFYGVLQLAQVPDLIGITDFTVSADPVQACEEEISYTVTVKNHGLAGTASNARVTTEVPDGTEFVSGEASQGSCNVADGTVTCNLGDLPEGHSATATINLLPTEGQLVSTTLRVDADGENPFPANDARSATTVVADCRCGEVLTEDTTLEEDIGPCPDNGLIVGADNITLDLNGNSVIGWRGYEGFGWPEWDNPGNDAGFGILGTGENETGVKLADRDGVTIKNGTVTGFSAGIVLKDNSSNNTVENLTVRENVGPRLWPELSDGIWVNDSPNNTIANNTVVDSGFHAGIGVWGPKSDDNTIVGNTVEGTPEYITIPSGYGIAVIGAPRKGDGMITGTQIANNTVRNNDGNGITSINNYDSRIANNVVEDNDGRNQARRCNAPPWADLRMTCWLGMFGGDGISVRTSPDAPQETGVTVVENEVHGNSLSGIDVSTKGNKIVNNDAADNVTDVPDHDWFDAQFDLVDRNGNCDNNTWRNNEAGDGGSSPDCTTNRGR